MDTTRTQTYVIFNALKANYMSWHLQQGQGPGQRSEIVVLFHKAISTQKTGCAAVGGVGDHVVAMIVPHKKGSRLDNTSLQGPATLALTIGKDGHL